jgi:hypothetical protein
MSRIPLARFRGASTLPVALCVRVPAACVVAVVSGRRRAGIGRAWQLQQAAVNSTAHAGSCCARLTWRSVLLRDCQCVVPCRRRSSAAARHKGGQLGSLGFLAARQAQRTSHPLLVLMLMLSVAFTHCCRIVSRVWCERDERVCVRFCLRVCLSVQ